MRSFKKPTQHQIDRAVQRMRSPEFAAYFLSRLENPEWVIPLKEKGLFASPPPPVAVEGGGATFAHWPASKYLAQMAKHVPSEVASVFGDIETNNVFVVGDMVDAALAMPADMAVTLVPVISRAAHAGTLWIHFKDASELCVHLAEGGEVSGAIKLAEALFTPRFEQGQEQLSQRDQFWYRAGLKEVVPALVVREPMGFLPKLCDWLKLAVDATKRVDRDSGADHSYWWRPAIEQHAQNRRDDFAGDMVGFVRSGFERAIRDGAVSLHDALEMIGRNSYLIFKRLRLHLINEFAEQNTDLARQVMMDQKLFDDHHYRHEYAVLVGRRLDLLTPEERDTWYGWVDSGPDMSDFNETPTERLGREPTVQDCQNRRECWQFKKLHCVRKHLEGNRRAFYEGMLAKHGEPELAEFSTYMSGGAWGTISPMTLADLTALTFAEAVEKVSAWKPQERRFIGPDTEGLADTFREYVATDPEAFSPHAETLIGRPAIYVRVYITQMAEAVKARHQLDISALLKLCRWVLKRPVEERTTIQEEGGALVDSNWQWTRDEISRFIKNICEAKVDDTPKYRMEGLREEIWHVVDTLSRDPSQSNIVHDTSKDDPRIQDYLTLGINSPRGKAVEAGLEYARWVANHIKRVEGEREVVAGGFEPIPEVREMLEWHIAQENRSFEALTIIGLHLGLIYWIDNEWLATNADRLFYLQGVTESPSLPHGWAAWNSFLVWVRPHIEFYRLFKKQFAYAVAQSTQIELAEQSREQPMNHLGEHLITLFGRGQLGLDDDECLLRRFLSDTNPDIRRHAISFVGRSAQDEEKLPEDILVRFKELWELYWTGPGKQDTKEKPDAWLFGMWFSSGQFPVEWALEQLESFVEVTPTPEPDHLVVVQLARIASADISRTARILDRMVRGDPEGWRIHGWLESARQILEIAMESGGDAKTQAEQTIDYLGRRGHTSFGELLNPENVTESRS